MKKPAASEKLLTLNVEILRDITGGFGFPTALGPLTATLRTATVATRTMPHKPTQEEIA